MPRTYEEILEARKNGMFNMDGTYTPALTDEDYQVIVDRFIDDPEGVMCPGHTNDEMVNLCIACGMLGINSEDVIGEARENMSVHEWYRMEEHWDRIEPYANKWCSSGYAEIYMMG